MSTRQNDEWLAAAKDSFEQAVAEDSLTLALATVADVRDHGFEDAAKEMEAELTRIANGN